MQESHIKYGKTGLFKLCYLTVLMLCVANQVCPAGDWSQWRGPDQNGIVPETHWRSDWGKDGPKRLWSKEIGTGFSSITVNEGRAYTMGNGGGLFKKDKDTVYCFEARTGKEIWSHEYDQPLDPKWYEGGPSATPTVVGDYVYTFSKKGDVFCLDKKTGEVKWHRQIQDEFEIKPPTWGFAGSILVHGDMLILNAGQAGLALKKDNGEKVWQNGVIAAGYATPVLYEQDGEPLAVIFGKDTVYGVRSRNGDIVWKYPWKTAHDENIADPVICSQTKDVFVSSAFNVGGARLDVDTKGNVRESWKVKHMQNHMASSVLWQGYLYGFDNSKLTCVDFATGKAMWSHDGYGKGTLLISKDGRMLVLSEKGQLICAQADPEKFKVIAETQVMPSTKKCWTVPTLANGLLYARNAAGELVCVELK